jgi:hypothetical protein
LEVSESLKKEVSCIDTIYLKFGFIKTNNDDAIFYGHAYLPYLDRQYINYLGIFYGHAYLPYVDRQYINYL